MNTSINDMTKIIALAGGIILPMFWASFAAAAPMLGCS